MWNIQQYWSICAMAGKYNETKHLLFVQLSNIPSGKGLVLGINLCKKGVLYKTTKYIDTLVLTHIWGHLIS